LQQIVNLHTTEPISVLTFQCETCRVTW